MILCEKYYETTLKKWEPVSVLDFVYSLKFVPSILLYTDQVKKLNVCCTLENFSYPSFIIPLQILPESNCSSLIHISHLLQWHCLKMSAFGLMYLWWTYHNISNLTCFFNILKIQQSIHGLLIHIFYAYDSVNRYIINNVST